MFPGWRASLTRCRLASSLWLGQGDSFTARVWRREPSRQRVGDARQLMETKTGRPAGRPVSFQPRQTLRRGRHGRRAGGGRVVHHVVLKLAGVSLGVAGLAHGLPTFGTG